MEGSGTADGVVVGQRWSSFHGRYSGAGGCGLLGESAEDSQWRRWTLMRTCVVIVWCGCDVLRRRSLSHASVIRRQSSQDNQRRWVCLLTCDSSVHLLGARNGYLDWKDEVVRLSKCKGTRDEKELADCKDW